MVEVLKKVTMLEVVAINELFGTSVLLLKEIRKQMLQVGWEENNTIWQKNTKLAVLNFYIHYQFNKPKNCVNK